MVNFYNLKIFLLEVVINVWYLNKNNIVDVIEFLKKKGNKWKSKLRFREIRGSYLEKVYYEWELVNIINRKIWVLEVWYNLMVIWKII